MAMRSTAVRVLLAVVAGVAFAAGILTSQFGFAVLGMVAGLLLSSTFSQAGGLAAPLERFRDQAVAVRVWGASLVPDGTVLTLVSAWPLGAGLHIFFRTGTEGSAAHLKVAQPKGARLEPGALVIESARYVQWSGKRLPQAVGSPALRIALEERAAVSQREPAP